MGIRAPWGIAALFGVACLGEAGYIVAHRAAASSPAGPDVIRPVDEDLGLDLRGITTKIADQDKSVTVTFGVPGLNEDSARFDVNANRIRFRYDAHRDVKKAGSDVETSESVEKVLPLPPGAIRTDSRSGRARTRSPSCSTESSAARNLFARARPAPGLPLTGGAPG